MRHILFLLLSFNACDCGSDEGPGRFDGSSGDGAGDGDGTAGADRSEADGEGCNPPDMLIVLDSTMSMSRLPNGGTPANTPAGRAESKWALAVTAIEAFTSALEGTIRFGLERFPRNPGGNVCVTVEERLRNMRASNPECEEGQILVPPDAITAAAIANAIDPETTELCVTTPIAPALMTATDALAGIRVAGRDQYVALISDGIDTCVETAVLPAVQALARAGVKTYAIGFAATGGIDPAMLNDAACGGQTAPDFPAGCVDDGSGNFRAADPGGPALYLTAEDGARLAMALEAVARQICCDCVI